MSKQDYYQLLEVSRSSDEAEIKKAFRRLAMKYHPDRNPGDKKAEEHFKEIKEAYDVLSDPQKRQVYDQYGHDGVNQQAQGGFGGGGFGGFSDVFEDLFGNVFGGGGRGRQRSYAQAGADLRYDLTLTLEEAIRGKSVKINIPTVESCGECDGQGAKKGTSATTCTTCQGAGQVHMQQGFFTVQQACPGCRGSGKMIKDPCSACRGSGRRRIEKTLSVKVPAGVDTGDRVRLAGEGEAGSHGGPAGDLYVQIDLKDHPVFKRDGSHLHCEVPINFVTAALGGDIDIPTLGGRVKLQIPAETQTGKLFRLRGKGVKSVRDRVAGDLICRVIVETPVNLTKKHKELLKEFDGALKESTVGHCPRSSSWLDVVKKFFEDLAS